MAIKDYFEAWIRVHGRQYQSSSEYDERLAIFEQNAEMVFKHNSEEHSYTSKLRVCFLESTKLCVHTLTIYGMVCTAHCVCSSGVVGNSPHCKASGT